MAILGIATGAAKVAIRIFGAAKNAVNKAIKKRNERQEKTNKKLQGAADLVAGLGRQSGLNGAETGNVSTDAAKVFAAQVLGNSKNKAVINSQESGAKVGKVDNEKSNGVGIILIIALAFLALFGFRPSNR